MGGFNSGRHGGKGTTHGRNTLDVRKLQRDGVLIPGTQFESSWTRNGRSNGSISVIVNTDSVRLVYRHGGDTDMDYPVMLAWTPCNFGGRRAWWQCPCCGRRVALLYCGKVFSCRHCQRLAYESDRTAKDDKPYRRADNVRMRLGWGAGLANPEGDKPKGMHLTTYLRLLTRLNEHSAAARQSMGRLLIRLKVDVSGMGFHPGDPGGMPDRTHGAEAQ